MRIVKYRGTQHGLDAYPFLIDHSGISILPLSSLQLKHYVTDERTSSGVPGLDEMLEGKGFYRASTILVSGTAGTGKTTLGASFANQICSQGERCLYISFEESPSQVMRNMQSVGLDLAHWAEKGLSFQEAWRPTQFGLEMHLLRIHKLVEKIKPRAVIVDPISNLLSGTNDLEANSMMIRVIDFLKNSGITTMLLDLTSGGSTLERTGIGISSLADTWILLRDVELNGERNRCIYVLKSRGMAHSTQLREFVLTNNGIQLIRAYIGSGGELTHARNRNSFARSLFQSPHPAG